ncbi:T9SS type A sorting domain-containing protein, partial [bacterium]|nr:T9SS type A sorting domain-containing protein [bacterium]
DTDPSHYIVSANPQIHIEKATNGQDADTPTGPTVGNGSEVTWTYTVTNPGNVPVSDVVVTDDTGTPGDNSDDFNPVYKSGDTNGDGKLDVSESWIYEAKGTAIIGQYGNIAKVTGHYGDTPVDDDDPSHYFGQYSSIGDYLWYDNNGNGIQNSGETGIANQPVTLLSSAGTPLKSTVTNGAGFYLFDSLAAGSYIVDFDLPGPDYVFSPADVGSNNNIDSDVIDETFGRTGVVTLAVNQHRRDVDCGVVPKASISDYVWFDVNFDGIQDGIENGVGTGFVTVYLFKDNGNYIREPYGADGPPVQSMITDATGLYKFDGLIPGNYYLQFILPPGYVFSPKYTGSDAGKDSNVNPDGFTDVTKLNPGENEVTYDAGIYRRPIGSIGDYVWLDGNSDKVQDTGEPGIPDVEVQLIVNQIVVAKDTTDAQGLYLFEYLPAGIYTVAVNETTLPSADYFSTTLNNPMTVNLTQGQNFLDADFGYNVLPILGDGERRVLARYQPWFGDADSFSPLRHWNTGNLGGQPDTSLFNTYDAYDRDLLEYHTLLAWTSGIDGFVVDWHGIHSYGTPSLVTLLDVVEALVDKYYDLGFEFQVAVSYNEHAEGPMDSNFVYLADSILVHPAYWGNLTHTRRPLFIYNHEDSVYVPQDYRDHAALLPPDVFLLWNGTEDEAFGPMDVCYPWVQPLEDWDPAGLDWGSTYLDTTYWRINYAAKPGDLLFALGGTWPGHEDRLWVNTEDHFMDRQDTLVYTETWKKAINYNMPLGMPWAYVETWNDFNRGTEVEATVDEYYKFPILTRDYAYTFKGWDIPDWETHRRFLVPEHIHQARIAASMQPENAAAINAEIEKALDAFFNEEFLKALSMADMAIGIATNPVEITAVTDTSVTLTWPAAPHANAYNVYMAADTISFDNCAFKLPQAILLGNVTTCTVMDLNPETVYAVSVVPVDTSLGMYANAGWIENSLTGAAPVLFRTKPAGAAGSDQATGVEDLGIPTEFALHNNYPNPFNPVTNIHYDLPKAQNVKITVFDVRGRLVTVLVNEFKQAGRYQVQFDGGYYASGVYFTRIQTEEFSRVNRMMLLK